MKYIIRFFPEITVKSRAVRQQQIKQLKKNIRQIVKEIWEPARVGGCWDLLEVEVGDDAPEVITTQISDALTCIPGIHHFMEAQEYDLPDFDRICELTLEAVGDSLRGKTFAVRVQRAGVHDFRSIDLERYVGGYLFQHTDNAGVRLKDPDQLVVLQVHHQRLFIINRRREGMGGYPLGTQENVATLISGGYDSCVATWQMLQRGIYTHFIFFRLGGPAHEEGVKQVAYYLWQRYGRSHRVKFVTVPFEAVVEDILTEVDNALMGVVLKRCMIRCADRIAYRLKTTALITGEAISQVSSQTLTNLQVIDRATERLILRPLITTNKQAIVDQAKMIGAAVYAEAIPEYCAVISKRPTTRAKLHEVEAAEARLSQAVMADALAMASYQPITEIPADLAARAVAADLLPASASFTEQVVVLDVRAPDEVDNAPLRLSQVDVVPMPFYRLHSGFAALDQSREYWLYCDKGVMSQLQAQNLRDAGFDNVRVCPAELAQ